MLAWLKKRRERKHEAVLKAAEEAEERARKYREAKLAELDRVLKRHPLRQPIERKDFVERRKGMPGFLHKPKD